MKQFLHYENDVLTFGERAIPLADLAAKADGPVYVYDLDLAEGRLRAMQKALPGARVFYAMKANSHPDLLRRLRAAGAGADVVSGGEVRRALECGFAAEDIIYSGVGKTDREIAAALDLGVGQINVESIPELERIAEIARRDRKRAPVAFRLNPDVDIKTHPYIATGLAENKFGMDFTQVETLEAILRRSADVLELAGVSLHLGSQMTEFDGLQEGIRRLRPLYEALKGRFPSVSRFDAGGGLGIRYDVDRPDLEEDDLAQYAAAVRGGLDGLKGQLQLEPGRWIVAHAGVLLTRVVYVKKTAHRTFVIVESGMNHLMRPALYGARHRILPLGSPSRSKVTVDVAGPICESSDFFVKNYEMPEVQPGEWVAIADAGAYGYSMANTYNLQDLPKETAL